MLTDVNGLDMSNIPTYDEFQSLLFDFMLEHSIDHSYPDTNNDTLKMLCNLVICTLSSKNIIVNKNWVPKNMKLRYIKTEDPFEKFLRDIPGVGEKVAKAI